MPNCCKVSTKYKPVTHVIFDLDGTLIDSEGIYGKALNQTVVDYGGQYYPEFITQVQGTTQKDVSRVAIQTFNLEVSVEEFQGKYIQYANKMLEDVNLMPGAERFVQHLYKNNIPFAIATSSNQEGFELKTKKYSELFSFFHHIVCGGTDPEVINGKPAPDIFLIAASRFDDSPEPSKCLVFEDSANGLKAGLAAGMQVVMIPDPKIGYEIWKLATLRLDSFNYMIPQLFELPPFPEDEISPEFANITDPNILDGTLDKNADKTNSHETGIFEMHENEK